MKGAEAAAALPRPTTTFLRIDAMLTIFGRTDASRRHCDGLSRRDFLTIGGTLLGGGLSLPNVLAAQAATSPGSRLPHKALINIFLPGGPPHLDMWDLKPEAPAEIRGEFKPIPTNVPGVQICEHFPRIARMFDKFAAVRSLVGSEGDHDGFQCMTGRRKRDLQPAGGWPSAGAWVSKLQGVADPAVPAHLSLMYKTGHSPWGDPGGGGFLGLAHAPFRLVDGKPKSSKQDALPKDRKPGSDLPDMRPENMVLQGITLDRLGDRVALMKSLDGFRREADARGQMAGLDAFADQALGILTSSKLADAMDLSREPAKVLERYGVDDAGFERDGAPRMVRNFCLARRLVEAGARVVTMNFTRWDWHGPDGKNFVQGAKDMPLLDLALSALVEDLHQRGLDQDVSVVVWGEFGRTPKINKEAGRDHWPAVSCALLAGGGMKTGQAIGTTDKHGGQAVDRPVHFQEVFATLYHNLGIDVGRVREFDARGRPQYLVDPEYQPIRELV